jgi:hypothetical protein
MEKKERERKNYQGLIRVARVASGAGLPFYGSKVLHDAFVKIEVFEAYDDRSYGSDRYCDGKLLASVEMSPIQWADLITNMNAMGIPCTIKRIGGEKMEEPSPDIVDPIGKIKIDMNRPDDEVKERIREVKDALKKSIDAKKPISPAAAKELFSTLDSADENYDSNRKFYKDQAEKELQHMAIEAVNTAEARINNTLSSLGLETLKTNLLPNLK